MWPVVAYCTEIRLEVKGMPSVLVMKVVSRDQRELFLYNSAATGGFETEKIFVDEHSWFTQQVRQFNVLLTVHHAMILGNCPT